MKTPLLLFFAASLVISGPPAHAVEKLVQKFAPADFAAESRTEGRIAIAHDTAAEATIQLLQVDRPGIGSARYGILGEVKYADVEGTAWLEMWNFFAGGGHYFSRTLAGEGPLAALRGTSDWRSFALPFDSTGAAGMPERLTLNLHLPGRGKVELRQVRLVELNATGFSQATGPTASSAWWTDRSAGLAGGIGGALIGCFGGLVEWLAARGRSQRLVLIGTRCLILLGAVALGAGALALALRQPYGVWYALLLLGALCVLIFPVRLRRYRERFRELELRRMQSLDTVAQS